MATAQLRIASDSSRKPIPKKVRLNQNIIEAATCPPGKSMVGIYDTEAPRLVLLITANGSNTFYAYRKENGIPRRYRLGSAVDTPIGTARKECLKGTGSPGRAHRVEVSRDQVSLGVNDDGIGLQKAPSDGKGVGLRTMAYRAHLLGGTLTVQPGERGGTTVTCVVRKPGIGAESNIEVIAGEDGANSKTKLSRSDDSSAAMRAKP